MGRILSSGSSDLSIRRPSAPVSYRLFVCLIVVAGLGFIFYHGLLGLISDYKPPVKLVVYGFSSQEEMLSQNLIPAFESDWESRNKRDLNIEGVFGPSGTLANQIVMGAPADVAILSNEQHVAWLRAGSKVDPETRSAIIGRSPIVIVTRPSNPYNIQDFADLAQKGLVILHPEPGCSGAGDWALLAEYGELYLSSHDRVAAERELAELWQNVKVLGSSAGAALSLFEMGAGDALVTYEQDALLAKARGVPLEIVLPSRTFLAQHHVVIVDENVTWPEKAVAEAFVHFLVSETGQELLAQYHMRPPDQDSAAFASIADPFDLEELGGWKKAYRDLIEVVWIEQLAPFLETEPLPSQKAAQD